MSFLVGAPETSTSQMPPLARRHVSPRSFTVLKDEGIKARFNDDGELRKMKFEDRRETGTEERKGGKERRSALGRSELHT